MTHSLTENTVCFGLFELDLKARRLTKNGVRIRLPQQPIEVLSLLLERSGEIVTREELRRRLWPSDVFVDFDHGLNKSIQKLRDALGDSAGSPRYIETIPRVGYRFIGPVNGAAAIPERVTEAPLPNVADSLADGAMVGSWRERWNWRYAGLLALGILVLIALGGLMLNRGLHREQQVRYTQLTDFTDSAVAPALSPAGRMVAFIRGSRSFLSTDQIYVKMLPSGEAKRVTDDDRPKYGLAFSPDGSEIAYTVFSGSDFSTYEVSALGGEPHLLLENAAGLTWLDAQHLLFSEIRPRPGIHMGVVTTTVTRSDERQIYFPAHERGMAHYSYASPDRRWALVVEMTGNGDWGQCRLIALAGQSGSRLVGPAGECTSAGWSPDGRWMYFSASTGGGSHIWRQAFPEGQPEQITSGPMEESGVAVEPGGGALITSVGSHESAIWIHDGSRERQLSSEGEVDGRQSPVFSADGSVLYYLLKRDDGSGAELWRSVVESGKSEALFPGTSMTNFDVSQDGKEVVYTTAATDGTTQLWLAPIDGSSGATRVSISGARSPYFGAKGNILFERTEGNLNYLEQIDADGSHHSKVSPFPILEFQGVSPSRRWVVAAIPQSQQIRAPAVVTIQLNSGRTRLLCTTYCRPTWTTDGRFLFVSVEQGSKNGPGRTLAIPLGPGESLPEVSAERAALLNEPGVVQGAESIARASVVPGKDREHYAWVDTTVHRNLYRILLP